MSMVSFGESHVRELPVYRRRHTEDLLNLFSNELQHPAVDALIAEALSRLPSHAVSRYPVPQPLLDALAGALGVSSSALLPLAGSDDAYRLLADAFSLGTPRTIVSQQLTYHSLAQQVAIRGLTRVDAPYLPAHRYDVGTLAALQAGHPANAVVWISDPNGPTGTAMSVEELDELSASVRAAGNLLVLDEVYRDYRAGLRWELDATAEENAHVLRIRSFSKSYGLAGARLGYLLAHPDVIGYLARWNTIAPVSAPALHLGVHLLGAADVLAEVRREVVQDREWLAASVSEVPGLAALSSEANFLPVRARDDATLDRCLSELASAGLAVRDMRPLRVMGPVLRVSMAQRPILEKALAALVAGATG